MNLKKFNLKKLNFNKTKTLILVGIITLLLFVGGATYAYFAFSSANTIRGNMEIISNTVDNLMFNIEKEIYINANLENFGQGMADLHDDTDATATLIPNNYDNQASAMYNIYLIIEANDLEYTTSEHTPELLLNVTDPNGNPLENITGLVHYDNGFDITTRTGGFLIASDYEITAQDLATIQTWNVEITLMNLDSNQNANMNKTFKAKLYLTQDKMSSYNPVQVTNMEVSPTYNTIDTTLNLSNGTADVAKYYFGIEETNSAQAYVNNNNGVVRLNNKILASADTVEYQESDTPNYRFTGLKENTEYTIYSYVEDVNGVTSNVYETRVVTNEYRIPSVGEVTYSVTLNSITVNVNASGGDGNITKYMYSRNDGESWEESTSNTHTFTGLNDTTEYKIKIKVVDSNGRVSTEYYKAISTETYILPVVASVDTTTTYNSITLTPSGTDGTGTIDHYLYSINNGEYQESNVFNNLNEQTEYTIRVKAIDNNGRETNPPYELQVTTDAYQVPTITNVSTSSTTNSITINVSASNGDGTITKYMYSRDNGSNWYESTSNSYTFSNLTSNTTFYVQVKVVDNNNRESAVSNTTVQTQYINPVVNSASASNITQNSVTLTVSATAGSNSIATYYYSNNNGSSYVSSSSNTYTFSGLSAGTTYNFRVYVVDSGGRQSNQSTTSATTKSYTFADYIKDLYTSQGSNGIYYHTNSLANSAGDNSYRYAGANPNNYVCFGSDSTTCPSDNLYRIIGVFGDEVKLIKNTYYIEEGWSSYTTSMWGLSQMRSIMNDDYYNSLDSSWQNKISMHTWTTGGMGFDTAVLNGSKTAYQYELLNPDTSVTYTRDDNVGLMYVSDYLYAVPSNYWTYPANYYSNGDVVDYESFTDYNWLYLGEDEWTMTRVSDASNNNMIFVIWYTGVIESHNCIYRRVNARPCFYLNSDVVRTSGTGTQSNPYRIN